MSSSIFLMICCTMHTVRVKTYTPVNFHLSLPPSTSLYSFKSNKILYKTAKKKPHSLCDDPIHHRVVRSRGSGREGHCFYRSMPPEKNNVQWIFLDGYPCIICTETEMKVVCCPLIQVLSVFFNLLLDCI